MTDTRELRVTEEILIRAAPEAVFRALVDPAELTSWWTIPGRYETRDAQVDLRVGGAYSLSGTSVARGRFLVTGEYLVVDPPHHLSYTWNPDWDDEAHGSIVDLTLEAVGENTRLVVEHTAFLSPAAFEAHRQGWPAVLAALSAHVSGNGRRKRKS